MKYVNELLAKRVFKFEDLSYLSDMVEKGDWSVAYDLTSGYYHVSLHPDSRRLLVLFGGKSITSIFIFPLGCRQPLGCFQKSSVTGYVLESQRDQHLFVFG
jgi:hypothetical protein